MSLFKNFSGGRSGDRIAGGYKGFRDQITGSARHAQGMLDAGYDDAQGRFDEFDGLGEIGMGANRLYAAAIGARGDEERLGAFETFENDPFREFADQNTINEINNSFSRYNAGGLADSGVNRLAAGRIAAEHARGDVSTFLNRLQGLAGQNINQGLNIAGNRADLDTRLAGGKAGIETSLGNSLAHSHLGHANYDAANMNTGINNLMKLVQTGANVGSKIAGLM